MTHAMVDDMIAQYRHTFRILYEEMSRFNDEQWLKGLSLFQTPVNQAMHIFDCLDFYFREDCAQDYPWGHRFGGGWWDLSLEQLPTCSEVEIYARELEERIIRHLSGMDDAGLSEIYAGNQEERITCLGHYVYAVRHTLHHHGQMAALAVFHGLEGGSWD